MVLEAEVDEHDIGIGLPDFHERFVGIGRRREDLEARLSVDHRDQPFAQQSIVVDEDQRNGLPGRRLA